MTQAIEPSVFAPALDSEPADEAPRRRLPAQFGAGTPEMVRHPDDGWTLADPVPMARSTQAAFHGIARAILPPAPAPRSEDIEGRVELQARRLMRYMPRLASFGIKIALHVLDWTPRLLFRSWRRLRGMDTERARELLDRLAHSAFLPLRLALYGVRGLIMSTYFDQEEVQDALGFAPNPWMSSRIAVRRRMLTGVEPADAEHIAPISGLQP